jgi:hypothetical protein
MHDTQRDIVVLGYSADVETLFRHLELEAPAMLRRIIVIDPRPTVLERLRGSGVEGCSADPMRMATLREIGLQGATMVLSLSVPGSDFSGGVPALIQRLKHAHPQIRMLPVARDRAHASELRPAGADAVFSLVALGDLHQALSRPSALRLIARVAGWWFAALIGITAVDARYEVGS